MEDTLKNNLYKWYINNISNSCFKSLYTRYIFENITKIGKGISFFLTNNLKDFASGTCLIEDLVKRGRTGNMFFDILPKQEISTYCIYVFYTNVSNVYVLNEYTIKDYDLNELIDNKEIKYYMSIEIPIDENKNILENTEE